MRKDKTHHTDARANKLDVTRLLMRQGLRYLNGMCEKHCIVSRNMNMNL